MTTVNLGWEYDGVDLTTLAYDVRALAAPEQVPRRRGDNVVVPGKTGRFYVAKQIDQRVLALGMFVDAVSPSSGSGVRSGSQLWSNLETLKGVFARDGQHTLKCQNPSATRKATVEVANVVEFLFADPWWYAESLTTVGPTTITMASQNISVTNAGTFRSEKAVFTLAGPLSNPKLSIGSVWVQYTGTVSSGQSLVIDCGAFTATLNGVDVSGNITHENELCWLSIPVGANTLNVATGTTGGSVKVEFYAPYV